MSTKLRLFFEKPGSDSRIHANLSVLGHMSLVVDCNLTRFFDAIEKYSALMMQPLDFYDEEVGLTEKTTDCYGNPLREITSSALAAIFEKHHPDRSAWDQAVYQFISWLPPGTRVVIWWY